MREENETSRFDWDWDRFGYCDGWWLAVGDESLDAVGDLARTVDGGGFYVGVDVPGCRRENEMGGRCGWIYGRWRFCMRILTTALFPVAQCSNIADSPRRHRWKLMAILVIEMVSQRS